METHFSNLDLIISISISYLSLLTPQGRSELGFFHHDARGASKVPGGLTGAGSRQARRTGAQDAPVGGRHALRPQEPERGRGAAQRRAVAAGVGGEIAGPGPGEVTKNIGKMDDTMDDSWMIL